MRCQDIADLHDFRFLPNNIVSWKKYLLDLLIVYFLGLITGILLIAIIYLLTMK